MEQLPDKIIGLDQVRINRGIGKVCKCKQRKFVIDTDNRRVTCNGCGAVIDPYEALVDIAENDEQRTRQVEQLLEQKKQIIACKPPQTKLFKDLEKSYRKTKSRYMLPCCPECEEPFYFEHIFRWHNRQFVTAQRKRDGKSVVE